MRFLDLDLDFFLDRNTSCRGGTVRRLGPECRPWSASRVRQFLEDRCNLSPDASVLGRIVETHDGILNFWHTLITSCKLKIPFEVIHIDAHPDFSVVDGLHLTSEFIYIDSSRGLAMLQKRYIHSGNYLTFAIVYGWIGSLIWITLRKHLKKLPEWNGDARSVLMQHENIDNISPSTRGLSKANRERAVPFKVVPWNRFKSTKPFDYIALSRSPEFTPPESDRLITVVADYMKQI